MTDVTFALAAKSDQLNAVDIIGVEPVIKIRKVEVKKTEQQPVWIYYEGDNNKPWKPCKGMLRVISGCWGADSSNWVGKSIKIFCNPDVTYGGQQVGGVRIRAVSHIPKEGMHFVQAISRTKRNVIHVPYLDTTTKPYPEDKFTAAFPTMEKKLKSGEMSLQQVVAQCQNTGELSKEQLAKLEAVAPIEISDNDDEVM